MLSEDQKKWLNHLSDTNKVKIIPYDLRVKVIFQQQKSELENILGNDVEILHKGASAWGISGKGDVDIYIPVSVEVFDEYFERLKQVLGEPGSYYHNERVRWNRHIDNVEIEIFLVNHDAQFYKKNMLFWNYIETHPDVLEAYRKIKEEANNTTTKEYYTRKVIFINKIMKSIKGNNH